MMVSTKGRYALRMMLDLAQHQEEGFIALKDVAARQNISKKYLEQIIPIMNKAGLLQTTRGSQGGYRLTKQPSQYTVGEILRSTESTLSPVACLEQKPNQCPYSEDCATLPVWEGLDKVVSEYLDGITLQDILDRQKSNAGNDYVI